MRKFKLQINSRIDIIIDDEIYKTVIQDVVNDGFLISVPINKGEYLTLKDGEHVTLENYIGESSLYRLSCNIIKKVTNDNVPLYKISLPTDIKKIQRRNYVRVNVSKQISYSKLDGDGNTTKSLQALLLDLSGGGLKLKAKERLHYGDKVVVNINIEELSTKVKGDVVRIGEAEDKRNIYGIRFEKMSIPKTEEIIRCVFTIMRKQRELV